MPIDKSNQEPTEDDLYLARMTMDEVGADIETHGHVAVTNDNRTQDPFSCKGALANALDEALDYSNPNYDPTNEAQGEVEGVTNDPQSPKRSDEEIKPDDTTMDKAPEVPKDNVTVEGETKTVKDYLVEALDSVVAMDSVTEVPEESDDDAHHKWEAEEIKKSVPKIPESLGGGDEPDSNGLIYLDYTFTVDPEKYNSPNYQSINTDSKDPNEQAANDKVDADISVEETIVEAGGEPTKEAEKVAAKEANAAEKEVESIGKPIEKKVEDEATEKVVLDYATFIDGSSFMCFDEDTGVDYTKIAMDAGPKKPVTRQTCKTTFNQCRAKNPLFCRFHGPKLLEKDIKSAISAAVGAGCVVSVTKDKGQKNPLTFRLTIGCPPSMKKNVESIVHKFMTMNPGISSPEEYKDLGNGKQTTEFDMDILRADEPPKKNDLKGQAAAWKTKQAIAAGKTMPVVGDTPPKIEKAVGQEVVQQAEEKPEEADIESITPKGNTYFGKSVQNFFKKPTKETVESPHEEVAGETPEDTEQPVEKPEEKPESQPHAEGKGEIKESAEKLKENELSAQPQVEEEKPKESVPEENGEAKGGKSESVAKKPVDKPIEVNASEPPKEKVDAEKKKDTQKKSKTPSPKGDGKNADVEEAANKIAEETGKNPSEIAKGIEERLEGKKPVTPEEADMIAEAMPKGSELAEAVKKGEEKGKKDSDRSDNGKSRIKLPGKVSKAAEKALTEAESYMKNPSGDESLSTAEQIVDVAKNLKKLDDRAKAIEKARSEKGRKTSALGRAVLDLAHDDAKSSLDTALDYMESLGENLAESSKKERHEAEMATKEKIGARIDNVLVGTNRMMYTVGKDGKTISDVNGVVDSVKDDLVEYGKSHGIDGAEVEERIKTDGIGLYSAELKASVSDMDDAVSQAKEALGKSGADFHVEDAEHLAAKAVGAITQTRRAYENLRSAAARVKEEMAKSKYVVDAKKEFGKSDDVDIEKTRKRIAKVYKDWVEDDVPEWVGEMDGKKSAEYADLLERASVGGGNDFEVLEELEAFEKLAEREYGRKNRSNADKEKASEKTEKAEGVEKPPESNIPDEQRKVAIAAARRLGVDAYKPTDQLRKMAILLRPRANGDARLEQRIKDIETILADREAKKDLEPKYVGDESPNTNLVRELIVSAFNLK